MASGGTNRRKVGVLAGVGCVAVAVIVAASGILSPGHRDVPASIGHGPATTAVTHPADPGPTADIEADGPDPADTQPEASPEANSSERAPAASSPTELPTDALPAEVVQALAEMASQLEQTGDDGSPREMTREEVDAMVTAQLQALGIVL